MRSTEERNGGGAPGAGLVYHAGGLGDFILSLPALFRAVGAGPRWGWRYWGPAERLCLLPGFSPAPAELARSGHTLWGDSSRAEAVEALTRAGRLVAFGGREPPPWLDLCPDALFVSSFPRPGAPVRRVPLHQKEQLDRLGVPPLRHPWLAQWRRDVLPHRSDEWLLLHPGSGDAKKNLPANVWAAVVRGVRERARTPVVLLLGPAEEERGGWEALREVADEVAPCGTLPGLLRLLGGARLCLGNDSGVSHLSGALGIPTVAFFGPSDPSLWRPLGAAVRIVSAVLPCAPCTAGGPIPCPAPSCLSAAAAGELAATALSLLGIA
ncbi:MAG: glycosyltransferase family 9 protein [Deltaproteobacteria bacterium]|nr:glycosyltransferase family 9 protein [Deltaproteobacteria bacterium]